MNLLFFLTPKKEVAFVREDSTLRQTLEAWQNHRYASIPLLDKEGRYVGTLTEGDILWGIKNMFHLDMEQAENIRINTFARKRDYTAVTVTTRMDDLLHAAVAQNFVPVVDDRGVFIGIVRRQAILHYFYKQYLLTEKASPEACTEPAREEIAQ